MHCRILATRELPLVSIEEAIVEQVRTLPPERQRVVLHFVTLLAQRAHARQPFFGATRTIEELAAEQGASPMMSVEELRAHFWPDEESVDDFVNRLREWRREDELSNSVP